MSLLLALLGAPPVVPDLILVVQWEDDTGYDTQDDDRLLWGIIDDVVLLLSVEETEEFSDTLEAGNVWQLDDEVFAPNVEEQTEEFGDALIEYGDVWQFDGEVFAPNVEEEWLFEDGFDGDNPWTYDDPITVSDFTVPDVLFMVNIGTLLGR